MDSTTIIIISANIIAITKFYNYKQMAESATYSKNNYNCNNFIHNQILT